MSNRTIVWQDRSLKWGFAILSAKGEVTRIRSGFLSPVTAHLESHRKVVETLPYGEMNRQRCDELSIQASDNPEETRRRLLMVHAADQIRSMAIGEHNEVSVSYCPDLDDRSLVYIEHGLLIRKTGDRELTATKDSFEIVVILDDGEPNPYVAEVVVTKDMALS